jgi:hypothetical protein
MASFQDQVNLHSLLELSQAYKSLGSANEHYAVSTSSLTGLVQAYSKESWWNGFWMGFTVGASCAIAFVAANYNS